MTLIECGFCKLQEYSLSEERLIKSGWKKIGKKHICPKCLEGKIGHWIGDEKNGLV